MIDPDIYKLSKYLLRSLEEEQRSLPDHAIYSNDALIAQINETIKKLKGFHDPGLTVFKHYQHVEEKGVNIRHFKAEMLEEDEVYDKFILVLLKEFCIIAIALLVAVEKQHKKQIFSGNLRPDDFLYNKRRKKCEASDPDANLAVKKIISVEKQEKHGDLVSFAIDLFILKDDRYLAPEFKQSMHVYNLQKKLKNFIYAAEDRGMKIQQGEDVKHLLSDFHQKHVKYTNKAEIYSIGYSLNELLSHSLEKLAKLKLSIHEFPAGPVDDELVKEADALLPDKFENHGTERIIDLLNEVVEYIHDLMKEQADSRDSLAESIAKFRSVLARVKAKAPTGSVLEKEEEESEEHDELVEDQLDEEYEEYEPEEHEEHEEHAHAGGGDHQHEQHEEHAAHDGHEAHEHEEHEHEEHEHEEHEAHEHADHEHEEHEEHDQHEEHKHEEHDTHEEHKHEEHEHHEAHEEHKHEEHEAHEEHEHEAHAAHEEHEHEHEAHEEHAQHAHESHEQHDASHAAHEEHDASHAKHSGGGGGKHDDDHHDDDSTTHNYPGSSYHP